MGQVIIASQVTDLARELIVVWEMIEKLMWFQPHSVFRRENLLDGSDASPVDIPAIVFSLENITKPVTILKLADCESL